MRILLSIKKSTLISKPPVGLTNCHERWFADLKNVRNRGHGTVMVHVIYPTNAEGSKQVTTCLQRLFNSWSLKYKLTSTGDTVISTIRMESIKGSFHGKLIIFLYRAMAGSRGGFVSDFNRFVDEGASCLNALSLLFIGNARPGYGFSYEDTPSVRRKEGKLIPRHISKKELESKFSTSSYVVSFFSNRKVFMPNTLTTTKERLQWLRAETKTDAIKLAENKKLDEEARIKRKAKHDLYLKKTRKG